MVKYLADNDLKKELDKRKLTFIRKLAVVINDNVKITDIGNRSRDDLTKEILKRVRYDFDNDLYRFRGKANQFYGDSLGLNPKLLNKYIEQQRKNDKKNQEKKLSPEQMKKDKERDEKFKKSFIQMLKEERGKPFRVGFDNKLPSGKTTDSFQYFKTAWSKDAKKKNQSGYNFTRILPSQSKLSKSQLAVLDNRNRKPTRTISTQT